MNDNYVVSKSFAVSPNHTNKKEILDDFGINRDTKTVELEIAFPKDFEVLYITGESGSGKSTILREVFVETSIDLEDFGNKQLIDMHPDLDRNLQVLSMFGLGDAALFTLYPNQLSDSQYKRAQIVKMVLDGNKTIVIDEFLSTLDRKTAQSIAFNIQKNFRRLGISLVAVTAHEDLEEYLKPDVLIRGKSFPSRFKVECRSEDNYSSNPITDNIVIKKGTKEEYREESLGEIHYKGKYSGGKQEYYFAYLENNVVGLLVTNNLISSHTRRISRVVVHPTYRGVGIAQRLIRYCINDTEEKVDTLAAMAKYNPVFERAGMVRVDDVTVKPPSGLKSLLNKYNFSAERWGDINYCLKFIENVDFRKEFSLFAKHANKLIQPGGRQITEEERQEYILHDLDTCARVLWSFRERVMAKFETKE